HRRAGGRRPADPPRAAGTGRGTPHGKCSQGRIPGRPVNPSDTNSAHPPNAHPNVHNAAAHHDTARGGPPRGGGMGYPPVGPGAASRAPLPSGFRRFFMGGLAALMPTLITLWLLVWLWNFLWDSLG